MWRHIFLSTAGDQPQKMMKDGRLPNICIWNDKRPKISFKMCKNVLSYLFYGPLPNLSLLYLIRRLNRSDFFLSALCALTFNPTNIFAIECSILSLKTPKNVSFYLFHHHIWSEFSITLIFFEHASRINLEPREYFGNKIFNFKLDNRKKISILLTTHPFSNPEFETLWFFFEHVSCTNF